MQRSRLSSRPEAPAAGAWTSKTGAVKPGFLLLVLAAVAAGLLIGVLVLQWQERTFYAASPSAWPQPGAGGPAVPSRPAAPVAPPAEFGGSAGTSGPAPAVPSDVPPLPPRR